jgi:3',5'-cyclic AMP phosphodiesterase CpdA
LPLTIAHLSDVHLGPLPPGAAWRNFALKRIVGSLSWHFKRKQFHDPSIVARIIADIKASAPDHVALTGDLVNISALAEFPRAANWLKNFGDPAWISFVPGNHDAYVQLRWESGLVHLAPYMAGEMDLAATVSSAHIATPFPYVRLRRNVALIGLSSAQPQSLIKAGGRLGIRQLDALAKLLRNLREKGYYRAVMIHHPPLPGLSPPRKALSDAAALRGVLVAEGAELVLHGHNHREMLTMLESSSGKIPIFGVPSASTNGDGDHEPAAWNCYEISRNGGKWQTDVTIRAWRPQSGAITTKSQFTLPS